MPGSSPPASRTTSQRRGLLARGPPGPTVHFPVVGIGASAGGLEACSKLFDALPAGTGMAFILVQHLDPTHESMMAGLLANHTTMVVHQATDGMPVEPEHLYLIPPGNYLSVRNGSLHLSLPEARHGARMPFDFLLHSLAGEYGAGAACVILSGTGTDGSLGLKTIRENGGLVIAQSPDEAGYDGMPRSAIVTGLVDHTLPVAEIAEALVLHARMMARGQTLLPSENNTHEWLSQIIDLLRARTPHDFTLYKPGTLQRRIERRIGIAALEIDNMDGYLEILRRDERELDLLAKDLLINVTSFFRDAKVFDLLKQKIIPELIDKHPLDRPLRIWIAACSTGEEAYSLAILFQEEIEAAKRNIRLQLFASDVDAEAVATAREGLFPKTIEADVSPVRLARFFSKEDRGYRVLPELRAAVIFTVQDVLADPPFSRLDMISCRNLLIYLGHEAQAKVLSLFHFALREGGILLIGGAETITGANDRFEVISKAERLYRHIGRSPPQGLGFSKGGEGVRVPTRSGPALGTSRQAALADLCRRIVTEGYAPAAVLINRQHEYLYSMGPIDRYLRIASGYPTRDLLAMAAPDLRTKLRSAIQQVVQKNAPVSVPGGEATHVGDMTSFRIDLLPVQSESEELLLICFVDESERRQKLDRAITPGDNSRIAELEQELDNTRTELHGAIRSLEISGEEQKAVNEEILSVNEEYQSTNEELLTSKEELQSLNEELTALNSQLQETLERQRTTSNDLQNVLYSTDVATIFLDADLKIRFFTPATKALFSVIPGDVGRPLADLNLLADDAALLPDARTVLRTLVPIECEIEARSGAWYIRRILPYRTHEKGVEGVVITFADITERRHTAIILEEAKRQAELSNIAKSRFLAAASHDLRQPLQTLALLQGLLTKIVQGEPARKLVARLDDILGAMSGMLNTILDINQIEAGVVHAEKVDFPISDLLDRLRNEFTYHAQVHKLTLRVVPCSLSVHSDPGLLEQMVRNLLSNALKYTKHGKVLLGCRRRRGMLSLEVWDTGMGIPDDELEAIFEEYHQLNNFARERSHGLGLGLAIVQRLGNLLDHRVNVRSHLQRGSVFSIEIPVLANASVLSAKHHQRSVTSSGLEEANQTGNILMVEDDPEVRDLLKQLLEDEGHQVAAAADGIAAFDLAARGMAPPDLILADYNLPGGVDGLQFAVKLREILHRQTPVIILTGDISASTLRDIAHQNCVQLSKPVKLQEMTRAIQRLLAAPPHLQTARLPCEEEPTSSRGVSQTIFVVDDDHHVCEAVREVLEDDGRLVETYSSCEEFLEAYHPGRGACLLIDAYLPGMNGLDLLQRLKDAGHLLPAVMITGNSDVSMAVHAMKAGALDFIEKPVARGELLAAVAHALEHSRDSNKKLAWHAAAAEHIASLTPRQHQIMTLVLAGHPSKNIASDLCISQRTVENHRAAIMKKTGSKSLPALARLALAAAWTGADEPPPRTPRAAK